MTRATARIFAVAACAAFAACGESTDLETGELTEAQAEQLAGALVASTFSSTGEVPQPAPAGPQAVPFEYASSFESDLDCPFGGLVAVEASFAASGDTESEAGSIEYEMRQEHDGCVVRSEDGTEFTLDGSPALELEFMVENNGEGVVEWGGSVTGAVNWVMDGFEGTCTVALEFSGRQEGETDVTAEMEGNVCQHSVSQSLTVG